MDENEKNIEQEIINWRSIRELMRDNGAIFVARNSVDELIEYLIFLVSEIIKEIKVYSKEITLEIIDSIIERVNSEQKIPIIFPKVQVSLEENKIEKILKSTEELFTQSEHLNHAKNRKRTCKFCQTEIIKGVDDFFMNKKNECVHMECLLSHFRIYEGEIDPGDIVFKFVELEIWWDKIDFHNQEHVMLAEIIRFGLQEVGNEFLEFMVKEISDEDYQALHDEKSLQLLKKYID
jgi:hypothetical protein